MICTVDFQFVVVHKKLKVLEQTPSMKLWLFTYLGMHLYDWNAQRPPARVYTEYKLATMPAVEST